MDEKDFDALDDFEVFRLFWLGSIDREEKLKLEIYALRRTLEIYANPKPSADVPLDKIVADLMADPIVQNLVHHEFDEARNQAEQLIQEGRWKRQLYQYMPKGKAN